ncbi:GIN domain-containing protein [Spirochaeta isovalerica]|uniref:Putative auto-transporter adhesin head GIN domain-containing protein n=1 Tax=Spirochaeta isovalerica TaxID=150 RepID=A0A841R3B9_9SPIO|nr:DUF2807 domain-containing protein [Spirochaeta isovalerica]MBB6478375.1 hypothetical protein [Spirochaeta isovalerica]
MDTSFVQRRYEFSGFNGISANGPVRIRIMQAEDWDVRVFSSREDSGSIKIRHRNEIFQIRINERPVTQAPTPVIVITMPELTSLELEGAVEMEAGGFSSNLPLNVLMKSGAYLNINGFEASESIFTMEGPCILHAFLSVDRMEINSTGKMAARLGGRMEELFLSAESSSRLDGTMLLVDRVELDLKGICEIRISPDQSLSVRSDDESIIYYNGEYLKEEPSVYGPALLRKY